MAYPILGQDAWALRRPDYGQRANQDLSSLDDGTAKWVVRPLASVPAVCPSKHRIAAAPGPERGCSATGIENARWRLKIVSVASAARPNYFRDRLSTSPSSLSSITGTILSSMRSLHISENSVSALTSSLSSRSKPPLKSAAAHLPSSFGTFRGSTAGCLKSPDCLVAHFGVRLQRESEHEFHRVLSHFLCVGPAFQDPRAQVRAWSHAGCILGGTRGRPPDPHANGNERPVRGTFPR